MNSPIVRTPKKFENWFNFVAILCLLSAILELTLNLRVCFLIKDTKWSGDFKEIWIFCSNWNFVHTSIFSCSDSVWPCACVSYFHISESCLKLIKRNFNRFYLILQIKIWFENNFFHQCCITLKRVKYLNFSFPTVMIYSIKMF